MLEKIREGSQGIIAKSILGLVILTFALAGVGSYLTSSNEAPVAVVNGEEIPRELFEQRFQNERARMQQQFGEMFAVLAADATYMQSLRSDVLERMIDETLQKQYAEKLGFRVSDEQIRDTIRQMPEFQVDGRFDNERYVALLRQAGYQPAMFRDLIADQMARSQLLVGLLSSEFATASEMQLLAKLQQQTRDIQHLTVKAADFRAQVALNDNLLQDYYATHIERFETEQKVAASYVELSAAALAANIEVTEAQVAEYYNANKARYTTEERRQVAHIMLESEAEDAAVAAEAEQLLQQLQSGADFAELAKNHSADTFSAEQGGVLDWLVKGELEAAFEQAAFELSEQGQLSAVVKTSYGYHIIKLVALQAGQIQLLAEVADDITDRIRQDKASAQFYDLQQRLAEIAFEAPDNLDEAAALLGDKVRSTPFFSRSEATSPLSQPKVLNRIFDINFIAEGLNSDVIEIAPQHVVVVRVNDNQSARTLTLDEVRADVEQAVLAEQSAVLAKQQAQQYLVAVHERGLEAVATEAGLTLASSDKAPRFGGTLDAAVQSKAFALARPVAGSFSADIAELASGDVAVVAVTGVYDAEVTAEPDAAQLNRLAEQYSEQVFQAVIAAEKAAAKISRNLRAPTENELF